MCGIGCIYEDQDGDCVYGPMNTPNDGACTPQDDTEYYNKYVNHNQELEDYINDDDDDSREIFPVQAKANYGVSCIRPIVRIHPSITNIVLR